MKNCVQEFLHNCRNTGKASVALLKKKWNIANNYWVKFEDWSLLKWKKKKNEFIISIKECLLRVKWDCTCTHWKYCDFMFSSSSSSSFFFFLKGSDALCSVLSSARWVFFDLGCNPEAGCLLIQSVRWDQGGRTNPTPDPNRVKRCRILYCQIFICLYWSININHDELIRVNEF